MHCTLLLLLASCLALTAAQQQSGRSAVTSALVRSLKHLSEKEVRPNADIGGPTVWVNPHLFGLEKLVCSIVFFTKKVSIVKTIPSNVFHWFSPNISTIVSWTTTNEWWKMPNFTERSHQCFTSRLVRRSAVEWRETFMGSRRVRQHFQYLFPH